MHSSALGAAARMVWRSCWSAARCSGLTRARYSSMVFGLSAMASAPSSSEVGASSAQRRILVQVAAGVYSRPGSGKGGEEPAIDDVMMVRAPSSHHQLPVTLQLQRYGNGRFAKVRGVHRVQPGRAISSICGDGLHNVLLTAGGERKTGN